MPIGGNGNGTQARCNSCLAERSGCNSQTVERTRRTNSSGGRTVLAYSTGSSQGGSLGLHRGRQVDLTANLWCRRVPRRKPTRIRTHVHSRQGRGCGLWMVTTLPRCITTHRSEWTARTSDSCPRPKHFGTTSRPFVPVPANLCFVLLSRYDFLPLCLMLSLSSRRLSLRIILVLHSLSLLAPVTPHSDCSIVSTTSAEQTSLRT